MALFFFFAIPIPSRVCLFPALLFSLSSTCRLSIFRRSGLLLFPSYFSPVSLCNQLLIQPQHITASLVWFVQVLPTQKCASSALPFFWFSRISRFVPEKLAQKSELSLHQMAVRALFGQKNPSCASIKCLCGRPSDKKSELSVYQMAIQSLVPQSPVTAEALLNQTTLVCSLKL